MKKYFLFFSLLILFVISCTYKKAELPVVDTAPACDSVIHYSSTITAIVTTSCSGDHTISCHESGSVNGDYSIYSVIKAKADNGTLVDQVYKYRLMPRSPKTISENDISSIYCWVKQGAPNN